MNLKPILAPLGAALWLTACSHNGGYEAGPQASALYPEVPVHWQNQTQISRVEDNWLQQFHDPALVTAVNKALEHNQALKIQALQLDIEQQQVLVSGAALWPSLDLSLRTGRSKSVDPTSYSTSSAGELDLSYELDLWGKLSDAEQQANLTYLAERASFAQSRQQLVADVVTAWYQVLSDQQLTALHQRRLENASQNLDIIEKGYQQGLNEALDVYLARNDAQSERSALLQQQASQSENIRTLERLLGDYPSGLLSATADIPLLDSPLSAGIPSELVSRKPELIASWYQLLAKDAALAYTHKQRFPSLNLSATLSADGKTLGDVFSPGGLAWSLLGGITAPLFEGGKLRANENIARLSLKQAEQDYLNTLLNAFNTVESALNQQQSLLQRYQATLTAKDNAVIAEELSFEQYRAGLVSYTTVLEAQSRSFDAQNSLITIKNQLIANWVTLRVALGGDFAPKTSSASEN